MKLIQSIKQNAYLWLILLIAAFLRIYHIDYQSLWEDEIASIKEANPFISLEDGYKVFFEYENMPPLYFVCVRVLFEIFGYSTLILRLFSAALGVFGVFGIYLLGKELLNKKVGLYAALILSVNYFHIYYSQEARPYAFLVAFTIFSFYYLARFVKVPTWKNTLLYALFTVFMLYGQYFALFTFGAQCLVLLYFLVITEKENRLKFFLQCLVANVLIILAFLPNMAQLAKNASIKTSWIPKPAADVFTTILSGFFGSSELVMPIIYLTMIVFFIKLFNERSPENKLKTAHSPLVFTALIVIPWIVISILIPLMRSYLVLPMIMPRYFNNLVPAVIIMAAIGFYYMQQRVLRLFLMLLLVVFSLVDLFIVKDYYTTLTKPQYNQAYNFIIDNRKADEKIMTRLGWHYGAYFETHEPRIEIEWKGLDKIMQEMIQDTSKQRSFWYADANEDPLAIEPVLLNFLNSNFYIDLKKNSYKATAIHFKKKTPGTQQMDLNAFAPVSAAGNKFLLLDGNFATASSPVLMEKGSYELVLTGQSVPFIPANGINAHITVSVNNKVIGGFFLDEKSYTSKKLSFVMPETANAVIGLNFDNDYNVDGHDRNAEILSVLIVKR